MAHRILIVDATPSANQDALVSHGGARVAANYEAALQAQWPSACGTLRCDVFAAVDGETPPTDSSLRSYDGIAWTGSPLTAYDDADPRVQAQIALARLVFRSGVPCFGSCWGLQVMTQALGGEVVRNRAGRREMGVARNITLTPAGRGHAMYAEKPAVFDALCIHWDEVARPAPGTAVLAGNAFSAIQAVEIADGNGCFWGVQYHPEFDLPQIATYYRMLGARLAEEGTVASPAEAVATAQALRQLHEEPRPSIADRCGIGRDILLGATRQLELANWLRRKVIPRQR